MKVHTTYNYRPVCDVRLTFGVDRQTRAAAETAPAWPPLPEPPAPKPGQLGAWEAPKAKPEQLTWS